jgi:hypothetical protein
MNIIATRRIAIEEQLKLVKNQLSSLQESCPHPDVMKLPKADTGNWDRGQDSYWYECSCFDCGKRWTEDQK